jgi:uncharacterized membrane protein (DUF106 family)
MLLTVFVVVSIFLWMSMAYRVVELEKRMSSFDHPVAFVESLSSAADAAAGGES